MFFSSFFIHANFPSVSIPRVVLLAGPCKFSKSMLNVCQDICSWLVSFGLAELWLQASRRSESTLLTKDTHIFRPLLFESIKTDDDCNVGVVSGSFYFQLCVRLYRLSRVDSFFSCVCLCVSHKVVVTQGRAIAYIHGGEKERERDLGGAKKAQHQRHTSRRASRARHSRGRERESVVFIVVWISSKCQPANQSANRHNVLSLE